MGGGEWVSPPSPWGWGWGLQGPAGVKPPGWAQLPPDVWWGPESHQNRSTRDAERGVPSSGMSLSFSRIDLSWNSVCDLWRAFKTVALKRLPSTTKRVPKEQKWGFSLTLKTATQCLQPLPKMKPRVLLSSRLLLHGASPGSGLYPLLWVFCGYM